MQASGYKRQNYFQTFDVERFRTGVWRGVQLEGMAKSERTVSIQTVLLFRFAV